MSSNIGLIIQAGEVIYTTYVGTETSFFYKSSQRAIHIFFGDFHSYIGFPIFLRMVRSNVAEILNSYSAVSFENSVFLKFVPLDYRRKELQ